MAGLAVTGLAMTGLAVTGPTAHPAAAQDDDDRRPPPAPTEVFVTVMPNTIQAGFQVEIRASCGDDLNQARVRSGAFGEVTLSPRPGSTQLVGSATVPARTRPGTYRVDLSCANSATAATNLYVVGGARPTRGPATGGGATAARGADQGAVGALVLVVVGAVAFAAGTVLLLGRKPAPDPSDPSGADPPAGDPPPG